MDRQICIGIRADGGKQMGAGHLMRCISIAYGLIAGGAKVCFYVADEGAVPILKREGMNCKVLYTDYARMEGEAAKLISCLQQDGVQLLLVDSYFTTPAYLERLNRVCPVFCLDDEGNEERAMPVSGVINYNVQGKEIRYEDYKWARGLDLVLLRGCEYAPVRPAFGQTDYAISPQGKRLLITMGGSDAYNIAGKLAERLLTEQQNLQVEVICGRFNPHLQWLQDLAVTNPALTVSCDVEDMWNHMAQSDLVVSAAGSTMYELCSVGVPTVCCYYVENQRRIAEGFGKWTEVPNCGDYSKAPGEVLEKLAATVKTLLGDAEKRISIAGSMKSLCDGQGALRLADRLIDYAEKKLWKSE